MSNSLELKEKRANLIASAKGLITKAESDNRDLDENENAEWTKLTAEAEQLKADIAKAEKQEYIRSAEQELFTSTRKVPNVITQSKTKVYTQREAFRGWLYGVDRGNMRSQDWDACNQFGYDPDKPYLVMKRDQTRDQTTTGQGANLLSAETTFLDRIENAMKDFSGMLKVADVFTTETGNSLPYPVSSDIANSASIITETTGDSELDVTYSKVTFNAYVFTSGLIKISRELLQDALLDMEKDISYKLGVRLGRALNTYCTTGSGSSQPKGIATNCPGFITSSVINYAALIDAESPLDPAYREGAQWMMNTTTLGAIKKLVDNQQRPLVVDAILSGLPRQTILGYPVVLNNAMPSSNGAVAILGQLNRYKIRMVQDLIFTRLDQPYAINRELAFFATRRFDGQPVIADTGTPPYGAIYLNSSSSSAT